GSSDQLGATLTFSLKLYGQCALRCQRSRLWGVQGIDIGLALTFDPAPAGARKGLSGWAKTCSSLGSPSSLHEFALWRRVLICELSRVHRRRLPDPRRSNAQRSSSH